jgi:hypothetical protein
MKKLLPLFFLFLIPINCEAVEIKLSCNISKTVSYSSGNVTNENLYEIFEIYENLDKIYIRSSSDSGNFPSVFSHSKTSDKIFNNSNPRKWDIRNDFTDEKGHKHTTSIVIDRNSGKIFTKAEMVTKSGFILAIGDGTCEKIDTTKKKF